MAAMVIVNNPGDWGNVYAPLLHADWHGWTPTDLIFPFFLFIVGVSITFASTAYGPWRGILRRGLVIFGLGLFLAGFPFFNTATWRIPGVLQRIAVCYLASVSIVRMLRPRSDNARAHTARLLAVAGLLLAGYAIVMQLVPVPGGVAGDLSPTGNLGAWLDRTLMRGHLWRPEWDPEGLLSTVPAIATTLLGVITGLQLRDAQSSDRITRLLVGGAFAVVVGYLWHLWFPINKNLWTSSYALFTAGVAAWVLSVCVVWSDAAGKWRARTTEPLVALGRNAILLFVLSGLIARLLGVIRVEQMSLKGWIYSHAYAPLASPTNASLLFAVTNLVLLYLLLAWLHRRRWYWRV